MMESLVLGLRLTFLQNYFNPAMTDGYVRLLYPDRLRHPRPKDHGDLASNN